MKKCEKGHKAYVCYIKLTDNLGKRFWKKIGNYCQICKKFIPDNKNQNS